MNKFLLRIVVSLVLITLANYGYSQDKPVRPSLGLALSGGGAFGIAHLGVLKVMEEAGLRPDYITGVSMGSIVGSMYSIGYSADSMYKIFRDTDWDLLLSNRITEDKVIISEKKYFNNSLVSLPLTPEKVLLPSGLISGQHIEKMLSYYAWPAAGTSDFSKLPIPFLCIGTDLISCSKIVLRNGYLPEAVRASMAVPSAFTPVRIDTAIIIDGGFVRNIAVSELKEMGADIIIGSYTGFNRYNENELQSITGVLKQLSFFNSINDFASERKYIDYLIQPKENGLSIAAFSQVDTIFMRGYKAAAPFREKFRRLADSLDKIGPQKEVEFLSNTDYYIFDRIDVTGNDVITDEQILGMLEISPGKPVYRESLNDKIDFLYGRSWFEKVKYKIVPDGGSLQLVIECTEKPQTVLYGAVHYDNFLREGAILSLAARNLISKSSMLELNSYIGQFYRFRFNLTLFPGKNQITGISFFFNTDNTPLPIFEFRGERGRYNSRSYNTGIGLNKRTGLNNLLSLNAIYRSFNVSPDFISEDNLKKITYNYFNARIENEINTLDNKYFPRKGVISVIHLDYSKLLGARIKRELSRTSYTPGNRGDFLFGKSVSGLLDVRKYIPAGRKISMSIGGNILYSYNTDTASSPQNFFYLGGMESSSSRSISMAGFHNNEIPVDMMAGIRMETDFQFKKDLHLGLVANIAAAREPFNSQTVSFMGGYGISASYMSVIGPLRIGMMQGFSDKKRYFSSVKGFFSIGFNF